jgi:hypothetical protein
MFNIFLTHNPFHVYIAECIVKSHILPSDAINVLLLEYEADYSLLIDHKIWSDVIYLEIIGKSTVGHANYKKCEKNVNTIKSIIKKNENTQILMSDIAWPMNNRIYFDKQLRKCSDYCLFSDGLGTYLLPMVTKSLYARGVIKKLNGLIKRGVKYTNYMGSQFGVDRKETKYIYASNVSFVKCEDSKKIEIPFSSAIKRSFNMSKCLFLDTPGLLGAKRDVWHLVRQDAINFLKSLGMKKYYYKGHHMSLHEDIDYHKMNGFNIINTNKCAEQVVSENNFGVVVAYFSSSLANLKFMYKDKIRCIALCSRTFTADKASGYNENKSDEVMDLFNKLNIEMEVIQ